MNDHTNNQEEFEETVLQGSIVARIIKDPSKLKGRLAKKFSNDSEFESSFSFDTPVKELIKPQNHTKQ